MKSLIIALILLTQTAHAWDKIATCDGDLFVVDEQRNQSGSVDYQAVFRGVLVESMLVQKVIELEDINASGEVVRNSSREYNGMISSEPAVAFQLTDRYSPSGNYSLIFHGRNGQVGNYTFQKCSFID